MGGGSSGFFATKAEDLVQQIRAAEAQTRHEELETRVSALITSLLAKYNNRDSAAIRLHLETIKKALEKEIDGALDLAFGGSVAKHTYVNGISDVDALVVLNDSELSGKSPEEVKDYFHERLSQRLTDTPVNKGHLAITVSFRDIDVQILPALKSGDGMKIPDATGKEWSYIRPRAFTDKLTAVNQQLGMKLIPTIKLAKSIIDGLPEDRRITGYHAESLAIEVFRGYKGELNPKAMLTHYFMEAHQYLTQPIRDRTGQSVHVDDDLGEAGSTRRLLLASTYLRIGRRMKSADSSGLFEQWADILGQGGNSNG